jgi:hypothetical protein
MATGRIGVTPTLGVRWSKAPAGGTTSLSGLDDNSVSLVYSVGYEQVYRNGVLLSRTNDYTATNGTSITLIDATLAGDIIEVFAQELVPLTDAISKGQFNAKGALLSATAAATPGVLTVGSNDQVLTADSSTSTGLKWAALPSSSPASASATVSTRETTTSTSYTNLTTSGPAVTLTTGTKVLVIVGAGADANNNGGCGLMDFDISGATSRSADNTTAVGFSEFDVQTVAARAPRYSRVTFHTVTAGSNTFTAKYRSVTGNTMGFADRNIIVIDLGS